jgi:hypothetical protein
MRRVARQQPDLELAGRFEPDEQQTFRHVPFTVPEGVDQLHLHITYNDQIDSNPLHFGGNTLDVGLFDQRGTAAGGPGFRGWSGSNKLDRTIGRDWSTPPYRAGAPGRGEWNVLLGAYKVGPNGLEYRVEVRFNPGIPAPSQPQPNGRLVRAKVPPAAEPGWYRGDLHNHTIYSDGGSTPAALTVAAAEEGLDFYGITDHNRAQSPVGLVPEGDGWPVLVPGGEVTTYAGHFNVWGTDAWYDFREPTEAGIQRAMDAGLADGGFVSINHPKPFGPPWEFPSVTGFMGVEVWNGWWGRINNVSLAWWDERLRRGERPTPLAGSDMHRLGIVGDPDDPLTPARLGRPALWVHVPGELTAGTILDALRAGECFISESPSGPQLYVTRSGDMLRVHVADARGDALLLIGDPGCVAARPITGDDCTLAIALSELPADLTYVRAELHHPTGAIRALSNAIALNGSTHSR